MIHHKDEALKKLCPLTLLTCVADDCMIWRWAPYKGQHVYVADNPTATSERDAGAKPAHCERWEFQPHAQDEPAQWVEPRQGYCGLTTPPGDHQ